MNPDDSKSEASGNHSRESSPNRSVRSRDDHRHQEDEEFQEDNDDHLDAPEDVAAVVAAHVQEEAVNKARADLRMRIYLDYLQQQPPMTEEQAELRAEDYVDAALMLKAEHETHLRLLHRASQDAQNHLGEVIALTAELNAALEQLPPQPNRNDFKEARMLRIKAEQKLSSFERHEREMEEKAKGVSASWYRPSTELEPSRGVLKKVHGLFDHASSGLTFAAMELDDLIKLAERSATSNTLSDSQSGVDQTASAAAIIAAAVAPKKKCARDFLVGNYVQTFSGDGPDALSNYTTWRGDWDHAAIQVKDTCTKVDDAALLHLLRSTLTGSAAKVAAASISSDAVLVALENKYNDIVALMNSFLADPAPPGESRRGPKETSAALTFIERWPRFREQLKAHEIDLDDFNGIRCQLLGFGGSAAADWRKHTKNLMRRLPKEAKLGQAYNWLEFGKWIQEQDEDAQAKAEKEGNDDTSSAGVFAVTANSGPAPSLAPGCAACGPSASHRSATCRKLATMEIDKFFNLLNKKGWCRKCAQHSWSSGRPCTHKCGQCGRGHLTSRHGLVVEAAAASSAAKKRPRERTDSSDNGHWDSKRARPTEPSRNAPREKDAKAASSATGPRGAWKDGASKAKGGKFRIPKKGGRKEER